MIDTTQAYSYFDRHLARAEFLAFSGEETAAALAMAEHDIRAAAPGASETDFAYLCAVCEQALYLLRNRGAGAAETVLGESVSGIGSRSYSGAGKNPVLAPRAVHYLELLRDTGSIPVGRG